jgi:hypothetical protein
MSEDMKTDRHGPRTASLGLGIAIVTVVLLGFGLLAFQVYRSQGASTTFIRVSPAFAKTWVEDLNAGRLDAAFAAATPAFQARLGREAFARWAEDNPEVRSKSQTKGFRTSAFSSGFTIGWNGIHLTDSMLTMTYEVWLLPEGKPRSVLTLTVVADATGNPLVDQAEIGPEAPSKP